MEFIQDNYTLLTTLYGQPKSTKADTFLEDLKQKSFIAYKNGIIDHFKNNSSHRDELLKEFDGIYEPTFYYMFGDYDLAAISLIDDNKFAARNLNPSICSPIDRETKYTMKYKSLTGFHTYNHNYKPLIQIAKKSFLNKTFNLKNPYISISGFKINNGFLLGGGDKVLNKIKNVLLDYFKRKHPDICFILLDSYSWYEISLIVFSNNIDHLGNIVSEIREFSSSVISECFENSLYWKLLDNNSSSEIIKKDELSNCHIFANSHSYFGINQQFFNQVSKRKIKLSKDFSSNDLKTEIEWEILPGHFSDFLHSLSTNSLSNIFNISNSYFLDGKYDYLFKENIENDISNNFEVIRAYKNLDKTLLDNVRGVKTKLRFEIKENGKDLKNTSVNPQCCSGESKTSIRYLLHKLSYSENDLLELKKNLLICKSGNYLHDKILNAYSNYNEGIESPVLFPYFIDFKGYLDFLKVFIESNALTCKNTFAKKLKELDDSFNYSDVNGSEIRSQLSKPIQDFHIGYENRIIQSYDLEDTADFNINYKGGIHQILSSFDLVYKIIGSSFLNIDNHKTFLSIGGSEIKSSITNVQSNVIHLFNPSIFLSTLTKESSNYAFENRNFYFKESPLRDEKIIKEQHEQFLQAIEKLAIELRPKFHNKFNKHYQSKYIKILFEDRLKYFRSDLIHLVCTFNLDIPLFLKWQWINIMQNPEIYDLQGNMNEGVFIRISFRQLFLTKYLKSGENEIINLIDSLKLDHLKEKHFMNIKMILSALFDMDKLIDHYDNLMKHYIPTFCKFDFVAFPFKPSSSYIYTNESYSNQIEINNIFKKTNCQLLDQFIHLQKFDDEDKDYMRALISFIEQTSKSMRTCFEGNHAIYYHKPTHLTPSLYLKSIIYTFLKYLINDINKGKLGILKRDKMTGKIDSNFNKKINFLIDPAGGYFTTTMTGRRKLFVTNQILLKSIWDFAEIVKKDFVLSYN